jgi:hypothetical protein
MKAPTIKYRGDTMVSQEVSDTIVAYHEGGMHLQEIAARLLLDIATVREAIEEYEKRIKANGCMRGLRLCLRTATTAGVLP